MTAHTSFTGKALRLPFQLMPAGAVVSVWSGPLRGARWVAGSYLISCWVGTYELPKAIRFFKSLKQGMVVYDIGANAGYYSLLASRAVGESGRIFAFEPVKENMAFLQRHAELNSAKNIVRVEAAVADREATEYFKPGTSGTGSGHGRLSPEGAVAVRVTSLDAFVFSGGNPPPDCIKIDVEGAEERLLKGALKVLKLHKPVIFLAAHSSPLSLSCCALLREAGYRLESLRKDHAPESSDEIVAFPK